MGRSNLFQVQHRAAEIAEVGGDRQADVLEHAAGKTVTYGKYAALAAENEQLKAKIAELEAAQEKPSKSGKKE